MSVFLGGGVVLCYGVGICVVVVYTVCSPLKKGVVAWCECIPRRCCVMLQFYVGICVDMVMVMCFNCCVCCTTFLKKVVVAWCECIPRRCQSEQSISL